MRDVKDESRVCKRSRQKSEARGNKCRGRDLTVGSFVDWRGGREMPRWWKRVPWSPWSARLGFVCGGSSGVGWLEGVHGYGVGQG
jgi:hypothetical protein